MRSLAALCTCVATASLLAGSGGATPTSVPALAALLVAPNGDDSAACTPSAPCRSFDRAYRVARPGQVVGVAAGAYPRQLVRADPRRSSPRKVIFRPQPAGAAVTVRDGLEVRGSHLEFRSLGVAGSWRAVEAVDVTFRRVTASRFVIASSTGVRVLGGSYGPSNDASNEIAPESPSSPQQPKNILVQGVRIHGFHKVDPNAHVDCMHAWGVNGLIVRDSRFSDCEHFDILFTQTGLAPPTNVTVENNFLDCCRSGYYSVYLGNSGSPRWRNFLIRNNSADKPMGIGDGGRVVANVRVLANVVPGVDGCRRAGLFVDYNVFFHGSRCGQHDRRRASGFVDPRRLDFHLRPGAAAVNHGDPHSFPSHDIDGQRRPKGGRPDAGADEAR